MQEPEGQVKLLASMGKWPGQPGGAARWCRPSCRPSDPGSAEAARSRPSIDAEWYEKNYSKALQEFLDMIAREHRTSAGCSRSSLPPQGEGGAKRRMGGVCHARGAVAHLAGGEAPHPPRCAGAFPLAGEGTRIST
jgi:hypothetical protein